MLFNRVASVEIGAPGEKGIKIQGLRIQFTVKKSASETSNTLELKIYNLSEATRSQIREQDHVVILRAGYSEADGEKVLSIARVTRVSHTYPTPDVVTTIEAGDGITERREVRVSLSYDVGVKGKQIVDDLALKLAVPVREIAEIPDVSFAQGFSFVGQAREAMNRVTSRLGIEWSIQNGELQILEKGGVTQQEAVLLTPETGLIGSPEPTTDIKQNLTGNKVQRGYTVRSLLNPLIEPGGLLKLKSRSVDSFFRTEDVSHTGDTHSEEWTTIAEIAERE